MPKINYTLLLNNILNRPNSTRATLEKITKPVTKLQMVGVLHEVLQDRTHWKSLFESQKQTLEARGKEINDLNNEVDKKRDEAKKLKTDLMREKALTRSLLEALNTATGIHEAEGQDGLRTELHPMARRVLSHMSPFWPYWM